MNTLLKLEWKKIRIPVFIATILATAFVAFMTYTGYKGHAIESSLEAFEIGTEFITILFPLLVVIPTCWTMYYERKNRFILYTLPRARKKNYLLSKWIVVAISAGVIMFISMFVGVIVALYVNPEVIPQGLTVDAVTNKPIPIENLHPWGDTFVNNPLLYGFLLSLWRAFLGVIFATMGFVLSLYVDNIYVILTGPFIYLTLENFILSVLKIPQYRVVTSFDPSSLSENLITLFSMLVGPILAILVILLIFIFYSKIRKTSIYKI